MSCGAVVCDSHYCKCGAVEPVRMVKMEHGSVDDGTDLAVRFFVALEVAAIVAFAWFVY
jgi:hypothetical protein